MSHDYKAVQWNPYKKAFDLALLVGVVGFLGVFIAVSQESFPAGQKMSEIQIVIRALGSGAFGLLTLVLMIGPLARISPRFKPLLYNRRHLGVTCFALALVHAGLTLLWYQGFSDAPALIALLTSNPRYDSIRGFPFESLGLGALLILFVMAATSHDFWNANLGPRLWKAIHMSVYFAYALLVGHILLGAIQGEQSVVYPVLVGISGALVVGLQMFTGLRETAKDRAYSDADSEGWLRVGPARDIPDGRAAIVVPSHGEKIAVFREGAKLFGVSNVCRHQGGPLGEGKIVDGCVTCPWHGFQYNPEDGCSPPPYTERVATYRTRVVDGIAFVHTAPSSLGAPTAPSLIDGAGL